MNLINNKIYDVVIIGAGPAGLTAGYLLTKKSNQSVKILEASPVYVGGISRTEQHNGYLFDIGGHRFFSKSEEINKLWHEILPDDFIERPRLSRIFYQGKFYSYPLKAFEALKNLGLFCSLSCVLSYCFARLKPIKNPQTFHEWVSNQFGERLYNIFFKSYTEKVWGMSCDEISADWAAQRIKGLSLYRALVSAIGQSFGIKKTSKNQDKVIKTLIQSFQYPRKGPGMMWETAAKKILAQGGTIEMGVAASQFIWNAADKLWTVKGHDINGNDIAYQAKHVITSAPLRDMVNSVLPIPSCLQEAQKLKYRDFITVAIMLKSQPIFDDNWIYIHETNVKVGRIQNFTSWSPEMVPNKDCGCLGLEYFCFEGNELWQSSDEELIDLAIRELEILKLATREQISDGYVVRQPKAYPVYDANYKQSLDTIYKEFELNYPQLHFVGRNGLHKYNNQDHSMMTSILTVENILSGNKRFNVCSINEDAEYHEGGTSDQLEALKSLRNVPELQR